MSWVKNGSQVSIVPGNTKHRVNYWVNENTETVVYVWYSAVQGEARIVEWDYSEKLEEADSALNKIRDVFGANRKIKTFAGHSIGKTQNTYTQSDYSINSDTGPFEDAIEEAIEMYNLPQ